MAFFIVHTFAPETTITTGAIVQLLCVLETDFVPNPDRFRQIAETKMPATSGKKVSTSKPVNCNRPFVVGPTPTLGG